MTKKHFQALAYEIKWIEGKAARKAAAKAVADACKQFNAAFDKDKFYEACGVEV